MQTLILFSLRLVSNTISSCRFSLFFNCVIIVLKMYFLIKKVCTEITGLKGLIICMCLYTHPHIHTHI